MSTISTTMSTVDTLIASARSRPGVDVAVAAAEHGLDGALNAVAAGRPVEAKLLDETATSLDQGIRQAAAGAAELRAALDSGQFGAVDTALEGVELLVDTPQSRRLLAERAPMFDQIDGIDVRLAEPINAAAATRLGHPTVRVEPHGGAAFHLFDNVQVGRVAGHGNEQVARRAALEYVATKGGTVVVQKAEGTGRFLLLHSPQEIPGPVEEKRFLRSKRTFQPRLVGLDPAITAVVSNGKVRNISPPSEKSTALTLAELRDAGATSTFVSPAKRMQAAADELDAVATSAGEVRRTLGNERKLASTMSQLPTGPGSGGPLDWEAADSVLEATDGPVATVVWSPKLGGLTVHGGSDLYGALRAGATTAPDSSLAVFQDTAGAFHVAALDDGSAIEYQLSKGESVIAHPDLRAVVRSGPNGEIEYLAAPTPKKRELELRIGDLFNPQRAWDAVNGDAARIGGAVYQYVPFASGPPVIRVFDPRSPETRATAMAAFKRTSTSGVVLKDPTSDGYLVVRTKGTNSWQPHYDYPGNNRSKNVVAYVDGSKFHPI